MADMTNGRKLATGVLSTREGKSCVLYIFGLVRELIRRCEELRNFGARFAYCEKRISEETR